MHVIPSQASINDFLAGRQPRNRTAEEGADRLSRPEHDGNLAAAEDHEAATDAAHTNQGHADTSDQVVDSSNEQPMVGIEHEPADTPAASTEEDEHAFVVT